MITMKELNPHGYEVTDEIQHNLNVLHFHMNVIRRFWAQQMIVTSGLRSEEDQYTLIKTGVSRAYKSNHLLGKAVDILDRDGSFNKWLKEYSDEKSTRMTILAQTMNQLWFEERQGPWAHIQTEPPKSGKRWFYP